MSKLAARVGGGGGGEGVYERMNFTRVYEMSVSNVTNTVSTVNISYTEPTVSTGC